MCLPAKSAQSQPMTATGTRSVLGLGALMLLACLAGPALSGVAGALGAGLLVGAGAAALCIAAPAAILAWRRRATARLQ